MATANPTPCASCSTSSITRTDSHCATGWLYVGESNGIGRIRFDTDSGQVSGAFEHIVDDFTSDGLHTTKTIGFGPDGWLYVSQGSSCNACIEKDERRATIMRMQPDGSQREIYATGLRNSVGLDWAPWDGALYATENGRDLLGDDIPPDELNRIEQGTFYGWPFVHGAGIADPDLGAGREAEIARATPPATRFALTTRRSGSRSCAARTCRQGIHARRSLPCMARGIAASPTATRWSPSIGNPMDASSSAIS